VAARAVLFALCAALPLSTGCATPADRPDRQHLFLWAGDSDDKSGDFLAVFDVTPGSDRAGELVATLHVPEGSGFAHHVEHEMPPGGVLAANDFGAGKSWLIDLGKPARPVLAGAFDQAGDLTHPHSFARLDNGNILATYQTRGPGSRETGGLAEFTPGGRLVRTASGADPVSGDFIRPYSLLVLPDLDRVVTTNSDMHGAQVSRGVQLWRLSDLKLLKTLLLPPGTEARENEDPAEPRRLGDGTVLVSTFSCGLYRLVDLAGAAPRAEWVHTFPAAGRKGMSCAVPLVAGRFWVQTDPSLPGLVALDMTDPRRPREGSRLILREGEVPHWLSLAPDGERFVLTGYGRLKHLALIGRIDRETGIMRLEEVAPGVRALRFDREQWPHGPTGPAVPHGAVFERTR
jgi:hypothetical protein